MSLAFVKKTYEKFGREDPLYAVLSRKECRHNRWDMMSSLRQAGPRFAISSITPTAWGCRSISSRALDFGCGVGRLSQALAGHFEEVVGVDIAESMAAKARQFNRHGSRVSYVVNSSDDLSCFEDGAFSFVYSVITLQHIPPGPAARYIGEFFRVLRAGGVAVFQIPSGRRYRPGSLSALAYRLKR